MNREMGFLCEARCLTLLYLRMIRGELAIGCIFVPQTCMR